MAVYQDYTQKRVRFDTTDANGDFISTTVDLEHVRILECFFLIIFVVLLKIAFFCFLLKNLWYMNMISQNVCVFEHVDTKPGEAGPRLLPNNDWVAVLTPTGTATINGILCNHYVIPKGYLASSFLFYTINYFGSNFYELHYYENKATQAPVRFAAQGIDPTVLPDTTFDVIQYNNVKQPFPAATFSQNTLDTCH